MTLTPRSPLSAPDPAADLVRKHARVLRDSGRLHVKHGNFEAAEECLTHTLEMVRSLDDAREVAETAELLAEVLSARDNPRGALDLLREAQRAREQAGDRGQLALTCLRIARVHVRRRQPDLALEYLEQALDRVEPEDRHTRALVLIQLAAVLRDQGGYRDALGHAEEARGLLEAAGEGERGPEREALGECLNVMGSVLGLLERHAEAVEALERSLAARRATGDRKGEAQSLNSLGIVLMQMRENPRARGFFEQALEICTEIGDARWRSVTLNNLGVVCKHLGDLEAAADHYRASHDLAEALGDRHAKGLALTNLAFVSYLRGDFSAAERKALEALRISRKLDERLGEVHVLERLCLVALATGRTETARGRATELAQLA